jgi:hypothetical protein
MGLLTEHVDVSGKMSSTLIELHISTGSMSGSRYSYFDKNHGC